MYVGGELQIPLMLQCENRLSFIFFNRLIQYDIILTPIILSTLCQELLGFNSTCVSCDIYINDSFISYWKTSITSIDFSYFIFFDIIFYLLVLSIWLVGLFGFK